MDLPEVGALGSVLDAAWARPGNRACRPEIIPRKCSFELTKDGTTLYKLEATLQKRHADMLTGALVPGRSGGQWGRSHPHRCWQSATSRCASAASWRSTPCRSTWPRD